MTGGCCNIFVCSHVGCCVELIIHTYDCWHVPCYTGLLTMLANLTTTCDIPGIEKVHVTERLIVTASPVLYLQFMQPQK
jgi:hypothetical protein